MFNIPHQYINAFHVILGILVTYLGYLGVYKRIEYQPKWLFKLFIWVGIMLIITHTYFIF